MCFVVIELFVCLVIVGITSVTWLFKEINEMAYIVCLRCVWRTGWCKVEGWVVLCGTETFAEYRQYNHWMVLNHHHLHFNHHFQANLG